MWFKRYRCLINNKLEPFFYPTPKRKGRNRFIGKLSMASIHCFFRYPVQLNTSTSRVPFSSFSFNCLRCSRSSSVDAHAAANKNVGDDVFLVTSSSEYDVDYLGETTKGDFNLNFDRLQPFGIFSFFTFPFLFPNFLPLPLLTYLVTY